MVRFIIALSVLIGLLGCVRVKPYQRETLSRPALQSSPWPGVERIDVHVMGVREGTRGATGNAGGGCGCN